MHADGILLCGLQRGTCQIKLECPAIVNGVRFHALFSYSLGGDLGYDLK